MDEVGTLTLHWHTAQPHPIRPVVATGVFDLLHVGHLRLLREAHRRGHPLAVGVEGDQRVRAWKGETRPLNPATDRAEVLGELRCVDGTFVITGGADATGWQHYLELLRPLAPHALVFTEGDPFTEPKRRAAEHLGAEVWTVPQVPDRSTSAIVERFCY
ncbi:adenylyltransferase/cytidyltransferase family protein [Rhodococcus sp. D2-41]|nr:adenylyltransferase/cytidyltransferase family protein [Rhodococcus sp. D2-41]